jgi:hypothetical protein
MKIDNDLLMQAIDRGKEESYGTDESSSLGQTRARAIEAYLGLNVNPAPEGRSQVVDRSVYETISTLIPSLVRIFAGSSEEVCKFLPTGPDDEQAAEQTTAIVSNIVTQQCQWEQIVGDWIMDAMLLSNGYARAYWDSSETSVRETYEGQSEDQVAQLLSDPKIRVVEHSQAPDQETDAMNAQAFQQAQQQFQLQAQQWQIAAMQAQQQGKPPPPRPQQPQQPQPAFLHDVVIERAENDGKVCIEVLAPEHCYVSTDTPDWTLKQCPYFEFRQEKTIADLRAMGLDVPEDVSDSEDSDDSAEDVARDRFGEGAMGDDDKGVMREVWVRSIWVRADAEGDGVARLYYVIAVGRTVLFAEPASRIPVASMTPQPLPHRHIGMSTAETVISVQEQKTAVKRGGLDNLYLANSPRSLISSKVSLEDMLDSRPGGVVRMMDDSLPAEGHIVPVVHPFAFNEIIQSLEYFDQERQNISGASRYFSGTDAGAINKTMGGTIALQNMASLRVEHIARVMAPAVEYLFECVHELLQKHANKAMTIKLRGQWVSVDPQMWRTKRDVRISVGVGAGNKESMQQQLAAIFGAQMQLAPLGLAKPEHIHATVVEMAKLAGFSDPRKFWGDSNDIRPAPQQPSPDMIKAQSAMQIEQFRAQQDQMKAQADMQIEQAKLQMQAELDKNREMLDAQQKTIENQQKMELEQQKALIAAQQDQARLEFERWKAELDASVKLQIAQMSNQTTMDTAQPKRDPAVQQIIADMQSLRAEYEAPAQIVRGNDGKAIAVKRGDRVRQIVRGPDGRAVGIQ